jgi:pimeloyl-ACP methyl ester carboxylesterase
MTVRERHLTTHDGLALFLRDYGDEDGPATPLLCLAGLTRNGRDFAEVAARLAPRRRVLCPDYRGRGLSQYDRNWRNYRPATDVRDIIDILAALNLHRVVVLGTSYGGIIGMALAAAAPGLLAGLVLNDIGPDVSASGFRHILEVVRHDRPQPDWDTAERSLRALFPGLVFRDAATWRAVTRNTFRTGSDGRLHFDWDVAVARPLLGKAAASGDLWRLFRAVRRLPVLALRGAESDVLSAECFARMAAEKPDIERLTVAGTGHAPMLDEPEVRDALDAFLAKF